MCLSTVFSVEMLAASELVAGAATEAATELSAEHAPVMNAADASAENAPATTASNAADAPAENAAGGEAYWRAKAIDCERRVYQGLPLSDEALVLMEKAICYLHLQAPDMAAKTLDRIALYALNDSLRNEVFALREGCQNANLAGASLAGTPSAASLANPQSLKNPDAARWLSMLPGAGHFYAGAVGEGFFSLALNAAAIAFIALELSSGLYVGAFLGGGIMLSQPYLGGTERAIQLVNEYNYGITTPQRIDHPF